MTQKLKSRKFWLAIVGSLLFVLNDQLGWGFSNETLDGVLKFLGLFILGEAAIDAAAVLKK